MKHPPKGPPGAPPGRGPPSQGSTGRAPPGRAPARPPTIAQRPQFDMSPEGVRAARQHLVETFGKPTKALAFSQAQGAGALKGVEIGFFGEAPAPFVLASAGASEAPCSDGARREWILILKEAPSDAQAAFLADVASAAAAPGVVLDAKALKPFTGVLLLDARALPEAVRGFRRKDAVDVSLGWVIPVFAEEARYARAEGADALFSHWERAQPDLTDLKRKPSVPSA